MYTIIDAGRIVYTRRKKRIQRKINHLIKKSSENKINKKNQQKKINKKLKQQKTKIESIEKTKIESKSNQIKETQTK